MFNSLFSCYFQVLSIYAPFWMINKTGKPLTYKGQDPQNLIYHPQELNEVTNTTKHEVLIGNGNRDHPNSSKRGRLKHFTT